MVPINRTFFQMADVCTFIDQIGADPGVPFGVGVGLGLPTLSGEVTPIYRYFIKMIKKNCFSWGQNFLHVDPPLLNHLMMSRK